MATSRGADTSSSSASPSSSPLMARHPELPPSSALGSIPAGGVKRGYPEASRYGTTPITAPRSSISWSRRSGVFENCGSGILISTQPKQLPFGSTPERLALRCTGRCSWRPSPPPPMATWSAFRRSGLVLSSMMRSSQLESNSILSTLVAGCNWMRARGVSPRPFGRLSSPKQVHVVLFAILCGRPHQW